MRYDGEDSKASNGKEIYIKMKERRLAFFFPCNLFFRPLFHFSVNSQILTLGRRLQITMFLKTKDSLFFFGKRTNNIDHFDGSVS